MRRSHALPALLVLALVGLPGCEPLPKDPVNEFPPAETLPQPTGTWLELGTKLLAAGRTQQAEDAFIRSLRVEGMTAAAFNGAGVAAQRQGLLTEAVRYFEYAKQLDPASVAAHNNLGAALYGLGQLHAARHAFKTAFALSSGASDEAARNLAMAEMAIEQGHANEPSPAAPPRKLQRVGSATYKLIGAPEIAGNG